MNARRSGQQTAEFALLIGVATAVAVSVQLVVRKAIQGGVQSLSNAALSHFSAHPELIASGGSSTLIWNVSEATSCTASASSPSGGWSGAKPSSGTETVSPTKTTTYALTCARPRGSLVLALTVAVGELDVTANQASDELGNSP